MSQLRKVYLPRWMVGIGLVFLVPMWLWVTWMEFFGRQQGELGLFGWVVITIVMAASGVVLVLMGQRRLPAYLIDLDDDGNGEGAPGKQ